jgi:hypothetical protein
MIEERLLQQKTGGSQSRVLIWKQLPVEMSCETQSSVDGRKYHSFTKGIQVEERWEDRGGAAVAVWNCPQT